MSVEGWFGTIGEFAPPPGQPRDWHGKWIAKGSPGGPATGAPPSGSSAEATAAGINDLGELPDGPWVTPKKLDAVKQNRASVIERFGEDGKATVDFVNGWTGDFTTDVIHMKGHRIEDLRAKAAQGDPAIARAVEVIKAAPPTSQPLQRGMQFRGVASQHRWESVQPGDELPVELASSFSSDPDVAAHWTGPADAGTLILKPREGVVMTLKPGSRALNVEGISNTPTEKEYLVGRPLRVVNAKTTVHPPEKWDVPRGRETHLVELEVETV